MQINENSAKKLGLSSRKAFTPLRNLEKMNNASSDIKEFNKNGDMTYIPNTQTIQE